MPDRQKTIHSPNSASKGVATHKFEHRMKKLLAVVILILSGCKGEMPLLLPNRLEMEFQCNMDPYKQGCERQMDYQEHRRWIKKPMM
jgi:hypothetical protein